jgi:hypothetical protein
MTRRQFIKWVAIFTAVHFVVALGSLSVGYAMGMTTFDTGGPEPISATVLSFAGHYLLMPGAFLWRPGMSSPVQLIIALGNSVLWGTVIAASIAGIRSLSKRNAAF